jgi:hypothetical protein
MCVVEIFKTNVQEVSKAEEIVGALHRHFPANRFNFDLSDCDRILRAESKDKFLNTNSVMEVVKLCGVKIDLIPD